MENHPSHSKPGSTLFEGKPTSMLHHSGFYLASLSRNPASGVVMGQFTRPSRGRIERFHKQYAAVGRAGSPWHHPFPLLPAKLREQYEPRKGKDMFAAGFS